MHLDAFRKLDLLIAAGLMIATAWPLSAVAQDSQVEEIPKPALEYREWQTADGSTSQLAFVRFDEGQVQLQDRVGLEHRVPLDELSTGDQQWINDYLETLWARIVVDEEVLSPQVREMIELFGSGSASAAEGPFAEGVSPIQIGGQTNFTPEMLRQKYGVPAHRTMTDVSGLERDVTYFIYGPIAVGTKPDEVEETWVRVDRRVARDGLRTRAERALGIRD